VNGERVVRWVRLVALFGGMIALVFAMVVFGDEPRLRDWAWTIGIALLVLSLVANRLVKRAE
jgi:hypothetical protein